jgi:hypothetical protein
MLYQINDKTKKLEPVISNWLPRELELENYLINTIDSEIKILDESVFGEPLLLISNQVRTAKNKRADILALDRSGNSVIIELKRNEGRLGVETQALQYLADFSSYKGKNFLKQFSKKNGITEETILGFIGGKTSIDEINSRSRVILVARGFDETIFSLGEWLSKNGVAFRCIRYTPIEIASRKMISFSIAFDHSPEGIYRLSFSSRAREPGIFWHNIASSDQAWWKFLRNKGQLPACFENSPGDQGETILNRYIKGDKIIAYARGHGALGWGLVKNPNYRLIKAGDIEDDQLQGNCRHRIDISWNATAESLTQCMSARDVREKFSIYHPISTSVEIDTTKGLKLIEALSVRYK